MPIDKFFKVCPIGLLIFTKIKFLYFCFQNLFEFVTNCLFKILYVVTWV